MNRRTERRPSRTSRARRPAPRAWLLAACCVLGGCSLGKGEGRVYSEHLFARECWNGEFDLQPDFFAAVPYRSTLQVRIQRGSDLQEVSDGLSVLIDDVERVREAIARQGEAQFSVALPAGVSPPGAPEGGTSPGASPGGAPDVPPVHMALYLQGSCHNQNTVLYAVSGSITFTHIFSGDPNEADAEEKLSSAEFEVRVGDPRDVPLGRPADEIPEELQSTLEGYFDFYFERGQPGQPFP